MPATGSGCTFSGAGTPANAGVWSRVGVVRAGNDPLGLITEVITSGQPLGGSQVVRMYSKAATTVKGRVACPSSDTITYDLSLIAGWNVAARAPPHGTLNLSTRPAGARSELRGQPATPTAPSPCPATARLSPMPGP